MHVLVTYKNEEDQIKNEGASVTTIVLPFKSMVIISDAQGPLTPKSQMRAGWNQKLSKFLWLS